MDKFLRLGAILFLTVAVMSTSGCEPLRKKFTRKKKIDATEAQAGAIYDPVDYPAVVKTSEEVYAQHYGLWKVWLGDLVANIESNANDKKIQYTLGQMQEQLSAMRSLLNADLQGQVDGYSGEVEQLSAEFKKPAGMRNKSVVESQIRSLDRRVKNGLAVDKVRDHLVSM